MKNQGMHHRHDKLVMPHTHAKQKLLHLEFLMFKSTNNNLHLQSGESLGLESNFLVLVQMGHVTASVCRPSRVHSHSLHSQRQTEYLWGTQLLGCTEPTNTGKGEEDW